MERLVLKPRNDYKEILWSQGFTYPDTLNPETGEIVPYWNEGVVYELEMSEVEKLAVSAEKLHTMVLEATEFLLTGEMGTLGYSKAAFKRLQHSYLEQAPTFYGRFDFAYDPGSGDVKLYEYNTDWSLGMLETGLIQAEWRDEVFPQSRQFNRLTEYLEARWVAYRDIIPNMVYFMHESSTQDKRYESWMNNAYMRELAKNAGYETKGITVLDLRWDEEEPNHFYDPFGEKIEACFKLYAWDDLMDEEYGEVFVNNTAKGTMWIEPFWRNLSENKATLAALHHLYPNNELVLPTVLKKPDPSKGHWRGGWVEKPFFGDKSGGITVASPQFFKKSERWDCPYVYQKYQAPAQTPDGFYVIPSVWMVGDEAVALGMKESDEPITGYAQRFTPHIIK